jgi:hypothetical protein
MPDRARRARQEPVLRFTYEFDAEVIDLDVRSELAGGPSDGAPTAAFLRLIRHALEQALDSVPGLRARDIGTSSLQCLGAAEPQE